MARYKAIDLSPRFLAVDLEKQLLPGSFAHAVHHLLDHDFDLSGFDARYRNDDTGASVYPPGMLLKIILCAYAEGVVSSRGIERLCREHVTFIALCGDSAPHFTTLAGFVSGLDGQIAPLFAQVLYLCDQHGLIGRQMFAIDGVKLPSNASKGKSGRRADFMRQADKLEDSAKAMLARHRANDDLPVEADLAEKEARQVQKLTCAAKKLRTWLKDNPNDRPGTRGSVRLSNRTDNDSAKMATDKGVIQGYCGVAAVDGKHQIIVEAQAHGTGSEQALLMPVISATDPLRTEDTLITADAGYHSKDNISELAARHIPALIADNGMRGRDERFKNRLRYKAKPDPLHNKQKRKPSRHYRPSDFTYDEAAGTCTCPAGNTLYQNGSNCKHNGFIATKFQGAQRDCLPCALRSKCLRTPAQTKTRQVCFFRGKAKPDEFDPVERMKEAIDSEHGRALYGRRFATVEPVFANLRYNKGLDRFTLRGQKKVDAQWKLFCMVHNIEKLARYGMRQ